ncbi:GNAT family N-acetyltransferase [Advenella sp. S44]|uniref:GNAT family N-acetyltransferase n=1 Tax=Advenella sp. S44 TaxID=1982755 RepID=UPI000C2AE98B|nr:GNAT family N-acetyltransferase [Advenella sp. S44]PJX27894.1 GNAT family N-acetyltransferase [Advenella sp. S44]
MTQAVQSTVANPKSDTTETPGKLDTTRLAHLENENQILAAFTVVQQLRPHLTDAQDMLERVQRMQQNGYRMLAIWDNTDVIALAGYRMQENLIYGPFLYVDDLVTLDTARGQRCGARLLHALQTIGIDAGCARLVLDTGLANSLAQRFYFRQGLLSTGMHFGMALSAVG